MQSPQCDKLALVFLFLLCLNNIEKADSKPSLDGHHLVFGLVKYYVILNFTRNASGYIIETEGILTPSMFWLSERLKFSFSFLQVDGHSIDAKNDFKGIANYLESGECDAIPGTLVPDARRLSKMDYVAGFIYSPGALLIQRPDATTDVASVVKPFQPLVWVLLIVSIPLIITVLSILNREQDITTGSKLDSTDQTKLKKFYKNLSANFKVISTYVIGILVYQGGHYGHKRSLFRVVAASWCLSAFILGTAYNSLLTSYIMRPNINPLIDSIEDVANRPDVFPVLDEGTGIEKLIMGAKSGIYKQLGDKVIANSKLRCAHPQDCVKLVKSGPYVYLNVNYVVLKLMLDDYLETKKCSLTIAKKTEYTPPSSWGFPKNSPYKEAISIGLAEMFEFGLIQIWTQRYQANPQQCLDEVKKSQFVGNKTRLTLKNLQAAFIFLGFGYIASIAVFILEKILFTLKS